MPGHWIQKTPESYRRKTPIGTNRADPETTQSAGGWKARRFIEEREKMDVLKWVKKRDLGEGLEIKNGWILLDGERIRISKVSAYKKHTDRQDNYLIGIFAAGTWHTVFKSESRDLRDENFKLLDEYILTNIQ